jgi:hypothetical protein
MLGPGPPVIAHEDRCEFDLTIDLIQRSPVVGFWCGAVFLHPALTKFG